MITEITYQKQTRLHDPANNVLGNCMMTCYANLLGFDVEDCPRIEMLFDSKKPNGFWFDVLNHWLSGHGYQLRTSTSHDEALAGAKGGYYTAYGESPRFPGASHQVIYKDGQLAFDPHPDARGILTHEGFEWIEKLK